MAPDLNSVPPSPRRRGHSATSVSGEPTTTQQSTPSPSLSRRVSQNMGPPPVPHHQSPGLGASLHSSLGENNSVSGGPGKQKISWTEVLCAIE